MSRLAAAYPKTNANRPIAVASRVACIRLPTPQCVRCGRPDAWRRSGAARCLRQCREDAARARIRPAEGNRHSAGDRRVARTADQTAADRKPGPVGRRRGRRDRAANLLLKFIESVPLELKEDRRTMSAGRQRWSLGDALVAGQTAVTLVLLVTAGLLTRSILEARGSISGSRAAVSRWSPRACA